MIETRQEILSRFRDPELVPHAAFATVSTFAFLAHWPETPLGLHLPRVHLDINHVDYLRQPERTVGEHREPLRFQQSTYRLWYQIDGTGVLQNLSRNAFGRATPGLLGIMDLGERHSYLHQRGAFECFLVDFSLTRSEHANCYWTSEIEGKRLLTADERLRFENDIYNLMRAIGDKEDRWGLGACARLSDIMKVVLDKGLLVIQDELFPHDKRRSLVAMARRYMDIHYADLQHQRSLSEHCGVDINYLNILFRKETRQTLYKYLTTVRMEYAKSILEDGCDTVVDIAAKVGYPNNNSFSRAFKRHTGVSPTDYLERHVTTRPPGGVDALPRESGEMT